MLKEKSWANRLWLVASALVLLAFTGCPGGTDVPVADVTISGPGTITLWYPTGGEDRPGTATLNAVIHPHNASNQSVTWGSDNPAVATVTPTGSTATVTAVGTGSARITVITVDNNREASIVVNVQTDGAPPYQPVVSISIAQGDHEIPLGGPPAGLTVVFNPPDATNRAVTWSGGNSYVQVSDEGYVTGLAVGSALVTATSAANPEASAGVMITVSDDYRAVTGVAITPPGPISLEVGDDPVTLTATVLPADATTQTIVWSGANASVEIVGSATGGTVTIRALALGYAYITATAAGGIADTVKVNVSEPADVPEISVSIDGGDFMLPPGGTRTLAVTIEPAGTEMDLTWDVYPPGVVTVNDGVVTAVAPGGYATITATSNIDGVDPAAVVVKVPSVEATAMVPFTWDFQATPAIPGWTAIIGNVSTPPSHEGVHDVVHVNNMILLPSRTAGGMAWGPEAVTSDADAAGSTAGRIQVSSLRPEDSYFLGIANVQGPFTITVNFSDTGSADRTRYIHFLVNGELKGEHSVTGEGQHSVSGSFSFAGSEIVTVQLGLSEPLRIYEVILAVPEIPVTSVATIPYGSILLEAGSTITVDATVLPANAANRTVTWSGANTFVEFVGSTTGDAVTIRALAPGTASIVATAGGIPSEPVTVIVPPPPPGASLSIDFEALVDRAPETSDIVGGLAVSLLGGGSITVRDPEGDIRWFLGGTELPGTGEYNETLNLDRDILGVAGMGTRFLTVVVEIDGRQYGRRIAITVVP